VPDLLDTLRQALADRYAVEREVGRGGMATVFLAQDVKHHRSVAIKVLHAELAAALGSERFLREIEIAARLQHPHILPLYDSGAAAGFLYYVMPYVEGESLRDRLTRERQLPQDDALRIATEVAGALAYAHSHGVVHRDIKPENIMLSGGTAVVADFGIARAVSAAGEGQHLTQTGTVIGTPAYMSPEQAAGDSEIDGRSDQYSLACVVYEMLVGEPPFTGPTAQAVIARHSMDMVSPPSIVRATIPDAVEGAILRALSKVPADRYATTALFAEALNAPSAATGAVRRATLAGARRRRPWRRELLAAALVLVAAAVAGLLIRRRAAPRAGTEGGLDPRRIAVLYFDDVSAKKYLGYLADGLTEALIADLAQVSGLQVISKNGVAPYRNPDIAPDSVARVLGAGTIVRGAVEETGNQYRVSVRLIEGSSGVDFRRAAFEVPKGSVLDVRDSLASDVADFLRQRLGEEVRLREEAAGTRSPEAWALVQQSERARKDAQRPGTDDTAAAARYAKADSLLESAERIDRTWVEPVVQRARVAYLRSRLEREPRDADKWLQLALRHADRAVQREPQNPDALEVRGTIRYVRFARGLEPDLSAADRLLAAARADLETATRLNPRQAGAWNVLSVLYYQTRDLVEANRAARSAYEGDAYLAAADAILWRLFVTSYDLELFLPAIDWCDKGHRRFPTEPLFTQCRLMLMGSKAADPDVVLAWRLADQVVQLTPESDRALTRLYQQMWVAFVLGRAGLADSARHVLSRSEGDPTIDPERELLGYVAAARVALGDKDEALRLLERYLVAHPKHREGFRKNVHWWWRGLQDDARFKALIGAR
jgi:serine/threonine-protein kinase